MMGRYAGFTEAEWRLYSEGRYTFSPPAVCCAFWVAEDWLAYIFGPRGKK